MLDLIDGRVRFVCHLFEAYPHQDGTANMITHNLRLNVAIECVVTEPLGMFGEVGQGIIDPATKQILAVISRLTRSDGSFIVTTITLSTLFRQMPNPHCVSPNHEKLPCILTVYQE